MTRSCSCDPDCGTGLGSGRRAALRAGTIAGVAAGLALGMFIVNKRLERQRRPIADHSGGSAGRWESAFGTIRFKVQGHGPALVLLHGFNAAASSHEMRALFADLSADFRVYLPDWLGFGASDRPSLLYTNELYVKLLEDFLDEVVREPAHVVASGPSAAYAVRLAARQPELFRKLLLVCPTGLDHLGYRGPLPRWTTWLVRTPLLGEFLFNLLVSRPVLRYYLQQSYGRPESVTLEMVEEYWTAAHQHNARYAPASFLGGYLNQDLRLYWPALDVPVCIAWGERAEWTPVNDLGDFLALKPKVPTRIFWGAGLAPHDESPAEFAGWARAWFQDEVDRSADE